MLFAKVTLDYALTSQTNLEVVPIKPIGMTFSSVILKPNSLENFSKLLFQQIQ